MRFLTPLNLNYLALSLIIILCATIIIWQLLKKMTPQDVDVDADGEAAIIRALIIARGPTGATLDEIRRKLSLK